MDTANVQINTDKKKRNKKVLLAVFIPLAVSSVILCIFLMYIGILQYPDWYLKANFRANKKYFETIINTDECDGFSSGQEWGGFYKEYRYDEEYISSEDDTDEKQRETAVYVFHPHHVSYYNVKLLVYTKDENLLSRKYNDNYIQNIEGNCTMFIITIITRGIKAVNI